MPDDTTPGDAGELLTCFDENGRPISPQPRGEVHQEPPRIWHGVVNIWLLNSNGGILCTRRGPHNSGNPGKWQTYIGGHVKAGKTFLETARAEVAQEIGLKLEDSDLEPVGCGRRDDTKHVYKSFAARFDEDVSALTFPDGEVSEARWLDYETYRSLRRAHPDDWCNSMTPEQYRKALRCLGIESSRPTR